MGKRSFTGGPAVPEYNLGPTIEEARYLARMARRFMVNAASRREVEEAIEMWRAACAERWPAAPASPGETPRCLSVPNGGGCIEITPGANGEPTVRAARDSETDAARGAEVKPCPGCGETVCATSGSACLSCGDLGPPMSNDRCETCLAHRAAPAPADGPKEE